MEYTTERIKQAEVAVDKLPSATRLANKYIASDDYKYDVYIYKEHNGWRFRSKAESMVEEIIGEEANNVARDAYWRERQMNTDVGVRVRKYVHDVANLIQQSIDKQSIDYRLSENFDKKFDVTGTGGARRVLNCEVRNAYALKYDGYFMLAVLKGEVSDNFGMKAGDYEHVTTADSLKEIALGLPYLINLNEERCKRELTELRERGQLSDNKVVFNRWFITDEMFKDILDEVMQVQERTYSVVRRTRPDWISFQVTPEGTDLADTIGGGWEVVGSGMTYDIANEMQRRVSSVITARNMVDNSATTLENAQKKLRYAKEACESRASDFVKECRNLDTFLHNKNISEDVIIELNKSLTKIKEQ
jgi:hypothetical protein